MEQFLEFLKFGSKIVYIFLGLLVSIFAISAGTTYSVIIGLAFGIWFAIDKIGAMIKSENGTKVKEEHKK